jgi:hypothetical protein
MLGMPADLPKLLAGELARRLAQRQEEVAAQLDAALAGGGATHGFHRVSVVLWGGQRGSSG